MSKKKSRKIIGAGKNNLDAVTYWKQALNFTEQELEKAKRRLRELELARDQFKRMAREGTPLPGS